VRKSRVAKVPRKKPPGMEPLLIEDGGPYPTMQFGNLCPFCQLGQHQICSRAAIVFVPAEHQVICHCEVCREQRDYAPLFEESA
jgi:hypothetical protein